MKRIKLIIALALVLIFGVLFFYHNHLTNQVEAQVATSSTYLMTGLDFDVFGETMFSETFNLAGGSALGNLGQFTNSNFFTKDDSSMSTDLDDFLSTMLADIDFFDPASLEVRMSSMVANMGMVSPGIFGEDQIQISVNATADTGGYVMYAIGDNPLSRPSNGQFIPNTNCDEGCDFQTAGIWTNPGNQGFGFNVTGADVVGFPNADYFKPFANSSLGEPMVIIARQTDVDQLADRLTTVNLRVSVPGNLQAGTYQNSLLFLVLPNL
ncbi:MAG: hypothetical protein LBG64_02905 [Pseudomonadales bacterium]|jgi:hypothetical protein|nr:hypothetical protein [Pseudomonadales bacterium]